MFYLTFVRHEEFIEFFVDQLEPDKNLIYKDEDIEKVFEKRDSFLDKMESLLKKNVHRTLAPVSDDTKIWVLSKYGIHVQADEAKKNVYYFENEWGEPYGMSLDEAFKQLISEHKELIKTFGL